MSATGLKERLIDWIKRNKSKAYSIRLNRLFQEAAQIVSEHPGIG
ncbi:hypothetical protein [Dyadobacter beijingensis]|nr:hypothetical protein [Dyadobacter beijingensis]